MFRIIFPNRWLVWTIVFLIIAAMLVWWQVELYIIEVETQVLESQNAPLTKHETVISSSDTVDTSTWKTYRNEKYGFEFKYRGNLKLTASVDRNTHDIIILSNTEGKVTVDIDIAEQNKQDGILSVDGGRCEDGGYHVTKCSDRVTDSGIHYARIVQSGMSTEFAYKAQYLKVYIDTQKAFLQFSTTIVNNDGTIPENVEGRIKAFDTVFSTLKFFEPT